MKKVRLTVKVFQARRPWLCMEFHISVVSMKSKMNSIQNFTPSNGTASNVKHFTFATLFTTPGPQIPQARNKKNFLTNTHAVVRDWRAPFTFCYLLENILQPARSEMTPKSSYLLNLFTLQIIIRLLINNDFYENRSYEFSQKIQNRNLCS